MGTSPERNEVTQIPKPVASSRAKRAVSWRFGYQGEDWLVSTTRSASCGRVEQATFQFDAVGQGRSSASGCRRLVSV